MSPAEQLAKIISAQAMGFQAATTIPPGVPPRAKAKILELQAEITKRAETLVPTMIGEYMSDEHIETLITYYKDPKYVEACNRMNLVSMQLLKAMGQQMAEGLSQVLMTAIEESEALGDDEGSSDREA